MTVELDGPRRLPLARHADSLVVLVHGYGANGDDLIGLADEWREAMPHTAFAAPNAPEPLPFTAMGGYQWFDLTLRDPSELWRGCGAAGPALDRFVGRELVRLGLDPDRLALVGFSQGTMLALHIGLRRRVTPAAIVGYSGVIAGPEHLKADRHDRSAGDHPRILLVHGEADDVISAEALTFSTAALADAGIAVSWHLSPGLGHGIDAEGMALGARFLHQALLPGSRRDP